jgi:hypothetical protein
MGTKGQVKQEESSRLEQVTFGLVVMTVGVLFFLIETTTLDLRPSTRWIPPAVMAIGLAKFISPGTQVNGRPRSRSGGFWLLWIGTWGLVNEYRLFGLYYPTSWPLLMIGGGLSIVWDAFFSRSDSCRATTGDVRS